jgi:hypothetical protein
MTAKPFNPWLIGRRMLVAVTLAMFVPNWHKMGMGDGGDGRPSDVRPDEWESGKNHHGCDMVRHHEPQPKPGF